MVKKSQDYCQQHRDVDVAGCIPRVCAMSFDDGGMRAALAGGFRGSRVTLLAVCSSSMASCAYTIGLIKR
jgi:hypothetical protein